MRGKMQKMDNNYTDITDSSHRGKENKREKHDKKVFSPHFAEIPSKEKKNLLWDTTIQKDKEGKISASVLLNDDLYDCFPPVVELLA